MRCLSTTSHSVLNVRCHRVPEQPRNLLHLIQEFSVDIAAKIGLAAETPSIYGPDQTKASMAIRLREAGQDKGIKCQILQHERKPKGTKKKLAKLSDAAAVLSMSPCE